MCVCIRLWITKIQIQFLCYCSLLALIWWYDFHLAAVAAAAAYRQCFFWLLCQSWITDLACPSISRPVVCRFVVCALACDLIGHQMSPNVINLTVIICRTASCVICIKCFYAVLLLLFLYIFYILLIKSSIGYGQKKCLRRHCRCHGDSSIQKFNWIQCKWERTVDRMDE